MSAPSSDVFEKLGVFYLGQRGDGSPVLYDAKHLVTHAVIVGMTGSGKTGLGVGLLEEAAIDGVPAIVVDPKGDLANLALTFPTPTAEALAPWLAPGEDAAATAAGLTAAWAASGQDGARVERLRAAADVVVYTPGSRAGRPLSVFASLEPPPAGTEPELVAERASSVASSLLGLVGVDSEPGRGREHVLLSNVLVRAFGEGVTLDLEALVERVQDPGFDRLGVLDLESVYPKKERFALAAAYNALLASPTFGAWREGDPLDVDRLLFGPAGRPRLAVLSLAHLGDDERTFFVSLLLQQVVAWMRRQTGTSSLRAILYFDEIVGFLPPVANPPTKAPLLLLLKQARAFGLGVVLATQNPVDLDYKALGNAGTWLVGRLQTERDRARLLAGLEPALEAQGVDRGELDRTLAALEKRTFVLHDVHAPAGLDAFRTRPTLSLLRGPMGREDLARLAARDGLPAAAAPATPARRDAAVSARPRPDDGVREVFLPAPGPGPVVYHAWVLGAAKVRFVDAKTSLDFVRRVVFVARPSDGAVQLSWDDARWLPLEANALASEPAADARFAPPPPPALRAKSFAAWEKAFVAWLVRTQGLSRLHASEAGLTGAPGEAEPAFRARLHGALREARDAELEALRAKLGPKLAKLTQKLADLEHRAAAAEPGGLDKLGAGLLVGAALFGGRRGSAASAMRRVSAQGKQAEKARSDHARALESYRALEAELHTKAAAIAAAHDPARVALASVVTRPKKADVEVELVALAWRPTA